jgi:hypothetical protein
MTPLTAEELAQHVRDAFEEGVEFGYRLALARHFPEETS